KRIISNKKSDIEPGGNNNSYTSSYIRDITSEFILDFIGHISEDYVEKGLENVSEFKTNINDPLPQDLSNLNDVNDNVDNYFNILESTRTIFNSPVDPDRKIPGITNGYSRGLLLLDI